MTTRTESSLAEFRADYWASPKVEVRCPVCEDRACRPISEGDRHGLGLRLGACTRCGLARIVERPEEGWFSHFYEHHYWSLYTNNDPSREAVSCMVRADEILAGITSSLPREPARCLDVSCGFGGMLCAFRRRFPDSEAVGTDLSREAVRVCRDRHRFDAHQAHWNEIGPRELPGPFGLVTMTHVLEHNLDPVVCLAKAAERLDDDGLIYVEVPDLASPHWQGRGFIHVAHTWYFTEDSLTKTLARAGLEPVRVFRGLAGVWPWGIGILAKRRDLGPLDPKDVPAIAEEELTAALARVRRQFRLEPGRAIIAGSEADHGVRETIRAILRRIRKTLVVPAFRHLIRTLVGQDLVGAHRHIHRLRREIDDLRALVQLQGDDIGRLHRSGDASRSRPCPTRILRSPHPQALVSGFAESDRGRDLLSNPVLSSLRQAQGEDRDREGSG